MKTQFTKSYSWEWVIIQNPTNDIQLTSNWNQVNIQSNPSI